MKSTATSALDAHRNPALEALLTKRGIAFRFVAEVPIEDIVLDESVQVRRGKHLAPRKQVTKYATFIRAGVKMPGVVLMEDGRLIDGNTRYHGYKQNRRQFMPAYLLSGISDDTARTLAIELNEQNGNAMDEEDVRAQILAYLRGNPGSVVKPEVWAAQTGISKSRIQRWLQVAEFDDIAARGGLDTDYKVFTDSMKIAIVTGAKSEVLVAQTVDLVKAANLTVAETRGVLDDVKKANAVSEVLAVQAVDTHRDRLKERISSGGMLGRRPSQIGKHQMHLTYLIKHLVPSDLDFASDVERNEFVGRLDELVAKVDAVRAKAQSLSAADAA